jgi:GNAT superfamily N-acetyltransferase
MVEGYVLREVTVDDASAIATHRGRMFRDMGAIAEDEVEPLVSAAEPWIREQIARGEYRGWLILAGEKVVAGGGVHLRTLGPVPGCLRVGNCAHIANMYTAPAHRRRGLGGWLMREILDWCGTHSIDQVTLTASAEARSLYESLGFEGTSDMRWIRNR